MIIYKNKTWRCLYILAGMIICLTSLKSQGKAISGDTIFWQELNRPLVDKFDLSHFPTSNHEFSFRFWNHSQVIEIIKNGKEITASITNYIFQLSKNQEENKKTLFQKTTLPQEFANQLFTAIQNSNILALPSDDEIEDWSQGFDGTTYIIEHADPSNYSYKTYWTPTAQDSLAAALRLIDFIQTLDDVLNLKESYNEFIKTIPQKGCYMTSGSTVMCYISNTFGLGYHGSTRLPLGYSANTYLSRIGNWHPNLGFGIQHQLNKHGDYDFSAQVSTNKVFMKKDNGLRDFISYNFRKRNLSFVDTENQFVSHKVYYGFALKKNLNIALGIDNLKDIERETGAILYVSKWMDQARINISGISSLFQDRVDFKVGGTKSIYPSSAFVQSLSLGLFLEKFKNYTDLNFSVTIGL